jgi:acetolactate synthase small subunit
VAINEDLTKVERIKKEERRLRRIYKKIDKDNKAIIDGLIQRAAYMRVTLEDYEVDLDEKGYVELFSQSEKTDPYERERPVARLYNTMNKNYQSIIKQLSDLVPKQEVKQKDDGFDDFISGREDA